MFYTHRTPRPFPYFFSGFWWRLATPQLYLTFDDGPVPEVTPFVLDTLAQFGAKATFFCVGENIQRYPALFERLQSEGHRVANHTMKHENGWRTPLETYLQSATRCQQLLPDEPGRLFRPPYGAIRPAQAQALRQENYQVVMWDVLSGDFDRRLSPQQCLEKSIRYSRQGSIVVFHDSRKAFPNLSYVLPRYLAYFRRQGLLEFACLPSAPPADIR